jgi:hypothetical protein
LRTTSAQNDHEVIFAFLSLPFRLLSSSVELGGAFGEEVGL